MSRAFSFAFLGTYAIIFEFWKAFVANPPNNFFSGDSATGWGMGNLKKLKFPDFRGRGTTLIGSNEA